MSGEFIDDDVTLSYCVTYPPCEGLQSAYAATDQNLENMCAAQPVVPVAFVGVCRVAGLSLRQRTGNWLLIILSIPSSPIVLPRFKSV